MTNANFFSDDTIFSAEIPFPAPTSVALRVQPEEAPGTGGQQRRYFEKVADGERIDHLAVPGALYDFLPDALKDKNIGLDPKAFADYATKLLPRAVGYSAALLDYFFRGKLEVRVEGRWDSSGELRPFIQITNRTERETTSGDFELYYDRADGTRAPLPGWTFNATLEPGHATEFLAVPPLPADLSPGKPLLLVFRGTLGEVPGAGEAEAVAAAPVGLGAYFLSLGFSLGPSSEYGEVFFLDPSSFTTPSGYVFGLYAEANAGAVVGAHNGTGSSRDESSLYRAFGVAPGDRASVTLGGACFTTLYQELGLTEGSVGPVDAELVELEEPADLAALFGYSGFSPPIAKRVIQSFSAFTGLGQPAETVAVDITGVTFLGLRITTGPTPPPPLPPIPGFSSYSTVSCNAGAGITILP